MHATRRPLQAPLPRRSLLGPAVAAASLLVTAPALAVEVFRGFGRGGGDPADRPAVRRGPARPPAAAAPLPATVTPAELLAGHSSRSLDLAHAHTGERLSATYWRDGAYLPDAQARFDRFFRDWREQEVLPMATAVLDILCALGLALGTGPLHVLSAYRTPATNAMLARSGLSGVARDSLHMQGRAVDFHLPGLRVSGLRDHALAFRAGGVGYYPGSGFIHIDDGPVRSWTG